MKQKNQHKPLPPIEEIRPHILKYWKERKTDVKIVELLNKRHIDQALYGIGLSSFKLIRKDLGLLRARQQGHSVDSIRPAMQRLRLRYPNAGRHEMLSLLFYEEGLSVPRSVYESYCALEEPELVQQRRARRLKRKQFWAAGVNDIWTIDQHDKWKYKFGLALHVGLEPFSGKILWIKVWWTNSNPRLILGYYLDTVERLGFMPLVSQSDPGVENFGVANGHTLLRHHQDPSLAHTLQHSWMNETKNVKPEIAWSQFRRRFTPGYETTLEIGINNNWYSPGHPLENLVFRWVFIPWMQREIDGYVDRVNTLSKRADRNKILPHGVPNDIFENADDYGALDFKVMADPAAVEQIRNLYAPRDHDVFKLVPDDFAHLASQFYVAIGSPSVCQDTVWEVYLAVLKLFENLATSVPAPINANWSRALTMAQADYNEDDLQLIPNLNNLAQGGEGYMYYGGVNNGHGLDTYYHAQLDAMMERDAPLPAGTAPIQIIEDELLLVDTSSDDDDADKDMDQVESMLTSTSSS